MKQQQIFPVSDEELPEEFKHFKYMGLKEYQINILFLLSGHVCLLYYFLYLCPSEEVPKYGTTFLIFSCAVSGYGITIGSHRYWTHGAFKAKLPLQILLMLLQTSCINYPIFKWCKDHRVHHKYTDTNADPHNSKRGFWFSHIGWLLNPKHPDVEEKLKTIEISDLASDPVVRFQSKHYNKLVVLMGFIFPMSVYKLVFPKLSLDHLLVWNMTRWLIITEGSLLVNSVAHMWGYKSFNRHISATDNAVIALFTVGEGWHNYHHTFPWDYKCSELGWTLNSSTMIIEFFAWIGWAYDLKTTNKTFIRTSDGNLDVSGNQNLSYLFYFILLCYFINLFF